MATEDKETLTIRLPKGLKELVDKAAEDRETTVTSIVREALQESLSPAGRMYQQPGFTAAFDEFLEKAAMKRVILLVADASTGRRYVLSGTLLSQPRNESLVALGGFGHHGGWIVPRIDVVAWFDGDPAKLRDLTVWLARQGWAERSVA
jgi:predicted transcriptional regulator